jgi:hypothetical protein
MQKAGKKMNDKFLWIGLFLELLLLRILKQKKFIFLFLNNQQVKTN